MRSWTEESMLLKTPYIDLLQLLKATGNAVTGGEAKSLVDQGCVRVNGEQEFRKRRKLRAGDIVELNECIRISVLEAKDSVGS